MDPHPVIVTIRDNNNYLRVSLYSCYTTIAGWGGPPKACCLPPSSEPLTNMIVSQNRDTPILYPKSIVALVIGTPKRVP